MTKDLLTIEGACHCGKLRFTLGWPRSATPIPVRVCGCTFCKKRGGSWTSHPGATLDLDIRDPDAVSRYRFGTATADFYVCSVCGVVPFIVSEIDGRDYAVVNVAAFEGVDDLAFDASPTDFDGENTESRLERRRRHWIGEVRLHESPAAGRK